MSLMSEFRTFIARRRLARERRTTEQTINSLPIELQKDIGWPGYFPENGRWPMAGVNGTRHS